METLALPDTNPETPAPDEKKRIAKEAYSKALRQLGRHRRSTDRVSFQ